MYCFFSPAPCIPQNLQTYASCSNNGLVSKWDHAEGALRYNVEAQGNVLNSNYNCSSQSNSCAMEGVLCGDQLTMTITAYDNECASATNLGFPAETGEVKTCFTHQFLWDKCKNNRLDVICCLSFSPMRPPECVGYEGLRVQLHQGVVEDEQWNAFLHCYCKVQ